MNNEMQLFLDWSAKAGDFPEEAGWMVGADGLVLDPCWCSLDQFERTPVERAVIRNGDLERDGCWLEHSIVWVEEDDLEQVARVRDENPMLEVVPRLEVSKAQVSYRFSGPAIGEGFSFYMPDTAAVKGWRINQSGHSIHQVVTRATELGFSTLWLHSPEAEARGKGLDLELLDKVCGGPLEVWISGGAAEPQHLRNLAKIGGASAVVVGERLTRGASVESLRGAMAPEEVIPEAVPVHFERRSAPAGQ